MSFNPTSNESAQPITPYLNPGYWGVDIDNSTADQLPPQTHFLPLHQSIAMTVLNNYSQRLPAQREFPLRTFREGDTFNANNYKSGTVFLSLTESLNVGTTGHTPMANFAVQTQNTSHPVLGEEDRALDGGGYTYTTETFVGVVTKHLNAAIMLTPKHLIGNRKLSLQDRKAIAGRMLPGIANYTIGRTYHFRHPEGQRLARTTDMILCQEGAIKGLAGFMLRGIESHNDS